VPAGITVVHDLFPSEDQFHALEGKPCDIVTSIAMFYDLEDPIAFARAIKRVLSPEGLWCVEMSYMPTMLRMTSYDTICHEHLEYYSLAVLEHIMRQADLRLVNVSLNAINGGSIRCYATHADNRRYRRDEFAANIKRMRQEEFDLELDTDKREVTPPPDFVKALEAAPPAWDRWRALSYSHQREHVDAIEETKKPETRARRIGNAVRMINIDRGDARSAGRHADDQASTRGRRRPGDDVWRTPGERANGS